MKHLCILLLISVIKLTNVLAADPYVTVTAPFGFTSLLPKEGQIYPYDATIFNLDTAMKNIVCTWTAVGNINSNLSYGKQVINDKISITNQRINNVIWDNTPNSGGTAKSIKVTVTYKVGAVSKTIVSPTYTVTVRYLGGIGPLNINGSTYSNGNSHLLSCGNNVVNLSAPAVVTTDPPVACTYYWTFPAGWNPSSAVTATPNFTATSSINSFESVKVEVKRNDHSLKNAIAVNIARPMPVINTVTSSDATLCTLGQRFLPAQQQQMQTSLYGRLLAGLK